MQACTEYACPQGRGGEQLQQLTQCKPRPVNMLVDLMHVGDWKLSPHL